MLHTILRSCHCYRIHFILSTNNIDRKPAMCQALFQLLGIKDQTAQRVPALYSMKTGCPQSHSKLAAEQGLEPGPLSPVPKIFHHFHPVPSPLVVFSEPPWSRAKRMQPTGGSIEIETPSHGDPSEELYRASEPIAPFIRSLVMKNCFLSEPRPVTSW